MIRDLLRKWFQKKPVVDLKAPVPHNTADEADEATLLSVYDFQSHQGELRMFPIEPLRRLHSRGLITLAVGITPAGIEKIKAGS